MCGCINEEKRLCFICSSQTRYWRSCLRQLQLQSWKGMMLQTRRGAVISVTRICSVGFKDLPDDLTCTQLLRHVPRNYELEEPIRYEDVVFERVHASYDKDKSGKKRKRSKTCDNIINPVPQ